MRTGIRLAIAGLGLALLVAAGILTVGASPPEQGEPPNLNADYVGSTVCGMCHTEDDAWHTTAHAQMVQAPDEDTILGDLSDTAALTIAWPDGSERAITAADITYTLGGRYMQRYVSVMPRADGTTGYFVLPVQWNVPQTADEEGMWTSFQAETWLEPERDWRVACAGCHTTGLDGATAGETESFALAADWQPGAVELNIGCEACHGPGSQHMGTPGTMERSPAAEVCGQCHVQGQSPDGAHDYPVGYQPGLALDESVFVLAPSDDETVWWPTGHARTYNEYGEWLASRHGQAVAMGPVCGRCHGTETDSTDPTPDDDTLAAGPINGITCVACHNPHPAAPSSYPAMLKDDPYVLCVSCHNSRTPDGGIQVGTAGSPLHHPVQEMFEGQEIVDEVAGVPSAHFSAAEGPRCATCHMPQTIQIGEFGRAGSHTMLPALPGDAIEPDSCSGCHGELVTRADIQRFITNTETITGSRVAAIEAQMSQTTPKWIETAMALINGDGSRGIHNPAYTDALLDAAEIELGIYPAMSPTLSPEDLGIPSRPQGQAGEQAGETNVAEGGLTTPSIVILVICGLILALGAYAFFVREPRP